MNILFASNGFPPEQRGGTETYTAGLARALAARGHDVTVMCGGTWDAGRKYWNRVRDEVRDGVAVRRLDVNWTNAPDPFRYLFDNPETFAYVRDYVATWRPHIVHVTSCERLSASVISAARESRIPVVLSLTDFWFLCPRMTLLRSDGTSCAGTTTAWECTKCLASGARVYRWTQAVLAEETAARVLATVGRVPLLARQRGLRGMIGDMSGRKLHLKRVFFEADCRVTASAFVRDRFAACGFDAPIRVQSYGHDIEWLARYAGKTRSDRTRLGFIGQITPHKGAHVLLEAVARLDPAVQARFEVHIFGDTQKAPEYHAELQRLASGLARVQFRGPYAHADSADVFALIDVLVVPSLWHDFPLVIHEGFASGTPVVATRLGGMAEVVRHDVNGLLFERGDATALAALLTRFVDEPGLADRLRRGIAPVKTVNEEADEFEQLYRELTIRSGRTDSREALD